MDQSEKDIFIILDSFTTQVNYEYLDDEMIESYNCILGYCPWIAQPELLVSSNFLVGLTYIIPNEWIELVQKWAVKYSSDSIRVIRVDEKEYYSNEEYSNTYMFEVFFVHKEPDRLEGIAITEDFWLIRKTKNNELKNVFSIGLNNPSEIAGDYDLCWSIF